MKNKIAIIGCGNVGSTIAFLLLHCNFVDEIVILKHSNRTYSEYLDLTDINSDCKITLGDYNDLNDANIIVVAFGNSELLKSKDRNSEYDENIKTAENIVNVIKKSDFEGIVINTTNPCEKITEYFDNNLNCEVIGTGCGLDTERFKSAVKNNSVKVIGEHNNNNVFLWDNIDKNIQIEEEIRNKVWKIIDGKGYTSFGISEFVCKLCCYILNDSKKEAIICKKINDKYISIPWIIGKKICKISNYQYYLDLLNNKGV